MKLINKVNLINKDQHLIGGKTFKFIENMGHFFGIHNVSFDADKKTIKKAIDFLRKNNDIISTEINVSNLKGFLKGFHELDDLSLNDMVTKTTCSLMFLDSFLSKIGYPVGKHSDNYYISYLQGRQEANDDGVAHRPFILKMDIEVLCSDSNTGGGSFIFLFNNIRQVTSTFVILNPHDESSMQEHQLDDLNIFN